MKITNKRSETKAFGDMGIGQLFILYYEDSDVYMKIAAKQIVAMPTNNGWINAFNLHTGELIYVVPNLCVIPGAGELIFQ